MLLPQTAEYALRAMAWLATIPQEEPVRARDLSQATGIPPHYLSKVLRRLVLADLLVSQKGQGGGFNLARPPEDIRFLDILRAMDVYPDEGHCAFGWGACSDSHPCPLHESWGWLNDQIRDWAATTTLATVQTTTRARRSASLARE